MWLLSVWFHYFLFYLPIKEYTQDCRNYWYVEILGTFQEIIVQGIYQKKSTMCQG